MSICRDILAIYKGLKPPPLARDARLVLEDRLKAGVMCERAVEDRVSFRDTGVLEFDHIKIDNGEMIGY